MNHSLFFFLNLNHHEIKHLWAANHLFSWEKDHPRVKQTQKRMRQVFRLLMLSRNDYLTAYSRLSVTRRYLVVQDT